MTDYAIDFCMIQAFFYTNKPNKLFTTILNNILSERVTTFSERLAVLRELTGRPPFGGISERTVQR